MISLGSLLTWSYYNTVTRSVFSGERMDLSLFKADRYMIIGNDSREPFRNPLQFNDAPHFRHLRSLIFDTRLFRILVSKAVKLFFAGRNLDFSGLYLCGQIVDGTFYIIGDQL